MTINVTAIVGDNVKRLRQQLGWNGAYLAKLLNIAPTSLSGIEHGTRGISSRQIEQLCEALGCLPYELFEMPDEIDGDLMKRQLMAEIKIMSREDIAQLCAFAVSLNAARGIKP